MCCSLVVRDWCFAQMALTLYQSHVVTTIFHKLMDTEMVTARVHKLIPDVTSTERNIVILKNEPRVSTHDVCFNDQIISIMIEQDAKGEDMKSVPIWLNVYHKLDEEHRYQLSAQKKIRERLEWARWECDKTRLLFAYFLRQTSRSEFSHDVKMFRLKQQFFGWHGSPPTGGSFALPLPGPNFPPPPPGSATGRANSAKYNVEEIAFLPPWPLEDVTEDRFTLAVKDFEDVELLGGIGAPPLAPPNEDPLPSAEHSVGGPEVISSDDECGAAGDVAPYAPLVIEDDGWFPIPQDFIDEPLPEPLPIGMNLFIDKLKMYAPTNQKKQTQVCARLRASMKRPAAAMPVHATVAAKKMTKTTRSAPAPPVEAPPAPAPPVETPGELDSGELTEKTREDTLKKCILTCRDKPTQTAAVSKRVCSTQRGTFHVQIKTADGTMVQVTDKQMGSKARAVFAADILQELWGMGASALDLQRCKNEGCFFNIKCGRNTTTEF